MPDNILSELNPRQREAVEAISGPVLIVAGPGSGKTRVITHRIAYLVDRCGVQPYRIAALTFTNKAAREMRERAATLIRTHNDQVTISTFHSFCARVLRRHGELLGLDKDYTIYDQSDQTSLVKRAMEELNIDVKQFSPGNILSAISGAKSKLIDVEGYRLEKVRLLRRDRPPSLRKVRRPPRPVFGPRLRRPDPQDAHAVTAAFGRRSRATVTGTSTSWSDEFQGH